MFRTLTAPAALAAFVLSALPGFAADIMVEDAYARSSNPKVGGVFFVMRNPSAEPVKLVDARSNVARKTELHTHLMQDGIARMRQVESIEIPAQGMAPLQRGGDHVMLMGLTAPLAQGASFPLTLVFDDGTEQVVEVTVDNERQDAPMDHGKMGHGDMKHDDMKKAD